MLTSLTVCDANYPIALDILKDRYGNKKIIFFEHLKSLFGLSQVQLESASSLRTLIDTVVKELRSLENLNLTIQEDSIADVMFALLIIKCLDRKTYELWNMKNEEKSLPKWKDLHKCIERRCRDLESRENPPSLKLRTPDSKIKSPLPPIDTILVLCVLIHFTHCTAAQNSRESNRQSEGQR